MLGLLCVQLGPGPKGEELFHSLQPLLVSVLSDSTASPAARLHVSVPCSVPPFCHSAPKQRGGFHLPPGSPNSEGEPSRPGTQAHPLSMTWLCPLPNSALLLWAWAAM